MTVVTAAPEKAAVTEAPAKAAKVVNRNEEEPGRAELIAEMEGERADAKTWLTLFYHTAIDYQTARHHLGGGRQVCVAGFNRWLRNAGFPTGLTDDMLPDRNAEVKVPGDDGIPLEHLTVLGLTARREAWHAAWDEKRRAVRNAIITGVGTAHGNFPPEERDKALEFLGLEPVRRKARVSMYVNLAYLLDQRRVSDAEIKEKVAKALTQVIGDGELTYNINDAITVEHGFVDAA